MASKKTKKKKRIPAPKKPVPFFSVHRKNATGWLICLFLVCGCMFFLGVLVGRNKSPVRFDMENLEKKLATLQDSVLKKESKIKEKIEDVMPSLEEIDFLKELKEKEKPEVYKRYIPPVISPKYAKLDNSKTNQKPVGKKPKEPPEIREAPSEKKPIVMDILEKEIQEEIIKTPKYIAPIASKEVELEETPCDMANQYAIQVASLRIPVNAQTLQNKLKKKGYPAYTQSSEIKGEKWYRVRIGPYPNRSTAEKDSRRLKASGVDALVFIVD